MFTIADIQPALEKELYSGTYIVVQNLGYVPPHLLLSHAGRVYSTTVRGARGNEDLALLLRSCQTKNTPLLFCRIRMEEQAKALPALEESMVLYPRVTAGGTTCLSPLTYFFSSVFGLELQDVKYIFELLPVLESHRLIENYSCLHYNNNSFTFHPYTKADIDLEIIRVTGNSARQNA